MRPRERRARIWPGRAGTARIGPARPDPAQSAIHTRAIYSGPVKLASREGALSLQCAVLGAPGRIGPGRSSPGRSNRIAPSLRCAVSAPARRPKGPGEGAAEGVSIGAA